MDQQELRNQCAEKMLEMIPMLRGTVNAYIHSEADRSEWVTPGQLQLLYLVSQGESSISDLAARQKTSAPTVSRQVDCLVEKGLLLRERKTSDRRVVVLVLTPRGEETLGVFMQRTRNWIAEHLKLLEDQQVAAIIRSFDALREVFQTVGN